MKTILAALIAALAVASLTTAGANASELTQIATSVLEYCPPSYYGW